MFFFLCYGETRKWKGWAKGVFTIPVLHLGNVLIPDPRNAGMVLLQQGRTFPISTPSQVSIPAATAEISALPDLPSAVIPQPNSVKEIQLIQALLIVEVSGFVFSPGWVFLTDCGAEWAGKELHLDRWSLHSQHCYYSHGGAGKMG